MPAPTTVPATPDVPVLPAPLGDTGEGWFTGRARTRPTADDRRSGARADVGATAGGGPGHPSNLAHRRPHRPADLARARAAVGAHTGSDPTSWHLMHQVHGAEVALVDGSTPPGAELRGVDAVVTSQADRVLAVSVADCVPVLLAGPTAVGAVHAGRVGVAAGVVAAALDVLADQGSPAPRLRVAVGPAIGGCCYEVPEAMRDEVAAIVPEASATTNWGTPSLDLRAAVEAQLAAEGVTVSARVGGCTRCDPDVWWFSHREDPATGRQLGLVRRRDTTSDRSENSGDGAAS